VGIELGIRPVRRRLPHRVPAVIVVPRHGLRIGDTGLLFVVEVAGRASLLHLRILPLDGVFALVEGALTRIAGSTIRGQRDTLAERASSPTLGPIQ
jgi:hypothetical protein